MKINGIPLRVSAIAMALAATGCASTIAGTEMTADKGRADNTPKIVGMASTPFSAPTDAEFPPNAKAGECYARVYVPPV